MEVMQATERLFKEVIPACAAKLDIHNYSDADVPALIHADGVNLRHIGIYTFYIVYLYRYYETGRIRRLCDNHFVRGILLNEVEYLIPIFRL